VITSLGLKYNLLTEYTSFIAVDKNVRNTTGSVQTIKQPLPLPEGVSDLTVGAAYLSVPQSATPVMEIKKKIVSLECRAKLRSSPVPASKSCGSSHNYAREEERQVKDALMRIHFIDANQVPVNGKAILFFRNSKIASTLDEIEAVVIFALNNRSVQVIIINNEAISHSR
jgi:hypothetical protein